MELKEVILKRKSVREFSNKKVNYKDLLECLHSMNFTSLAGGIASIKFLIIDDREKIKRFSKLCVNQEFISKSRCVIVIYSDIAGMLGKYGMRGERYIRQQGGASIHNLLLCLTEKGIGACWVGAFRDDQIREYLNIPKYTYIEAVIPVGYEK